MDNETAGYIVDYIEILEEMVNFNRVLIELAARGFTEAEMDKALKALGAIAGRDCGIL